jgi:hypothetical protein
MDFLITNLISNDLKIIYLCIDEDDYAYSTKTRNMLSHSWKTSVHICALVKIPGVWDPFVKSYVEVSVFFIRLY